MLKLGFHSLPALGTKDLLCWCGGTEEGMLHSGDDPELCCGYRWPQCEHFEDQRAHELLWLEAY